MNVCLDADLYRFSCNSSTISKERLTSCVCVYFGIECQCFGYFQYIYIECSWDALRCLLCVWFQKPRATCSSIACNCIERLRLSIVKRVHRNTSDQLKKAKEAHRFAITRGEKNEKAEKVERKRRKKARANFLLDEDFMLICSKPVFRVVLKTITLHRIRDQNETE